MYLEKVPQSVRSISVPLEVVSNGKGRTQKGGSTIMLSSDGTTGSLIAASETSESVVVVGLGVVVTILFSRHDSLQNPQLNWPPICSSSLSIFVEHQYFPSGSVSSVHSFSNVPLNFQGNLHSEFLSGLSSVVRHLGPGELEVEIIGTIVEGTDATVDAVAVGLGIGPLKRGNFKSFDEQLFSSE